MHDAIWPYRSGNTVVDLVLFIVFAVVLGIGLAWGMRIGNKLP
jgi:hypothetical protein